MAFSRCSHDTGDLSVYDLGKTYSRGKNKTLKGLYHHIAVDDEVIGGNTSIRNVDADHLEWKGNPNGNGYGYFQRNRDLGQVFTVPEDYDVTVDALVLRTSRGNNAIMKGAIGAKMYVVFYEVLLNVSGPLRINENGTTKGDMAKHGFDLQFNRADDYLEGAKYVPFHLSVGGIFPNIPATSQFVYDNGKNVPFGEQEGHLRFIRLDFLENSEIRFQGSKTYAFMVGFMEPAPDRGLALAISSEVHTKEPATFVKDKLGNVRWGIRREGNGTTPPKMIGQSQPPVDPLALKQLQDESLFPDNHFKTLPPTTDGYPDVDTYRTLQFYLELKEVKEKKE